MPYSIIDREEHKFLKHISVKEFEKRIKKLKIFCEYKLTKKEKKYYQNGRNSKFWLDYTDGYYDLSKSHRVYKFYWIPVVVWYSRDNYKWLIKSDMESDKKNKDFINEEMYTIDSYIKRNDKNYFIFPCVSNNDGKYIEHWICCGNNAINTPKLCTSRFGYKDGNSFTRPEIYEIQAYIFGRTNIMPKIKLPPTSILYKKNQIKYANEIKKYKIKLVK